MSKKGVSDVITTVLMILIVLAAIGIVWAVVSSFLNNSTEQIDLGAGFSQIDIVDNSVKYLPSDVLQIKVKRDSNPGNISGLRVIIESSEGNVQSYDINTPVKELETKTIDVQLQGKITNISKVSIAPRTPIKNKIKTGQTADEQVIGRGVVGNEGLVLYLPFDNDFQDHSGNGNNGSCTGNNCPSTSTGKIGSAYDFDGINDYVNVGNNNLLNPQDISAFSWIKFDSIDPAIQSTQNYILSNSRDCCGSYKGYEIRIVSNKSFVRLWNSAADSVSGNIDILPNTWYYLGFTYNKTNIILYVNGQLDKSYSSSIGIGNPASYNLAIGGMGMDPVTYNMNGSIDEVRIYNRSLSSQEVYYLYKYG